MGGGVPFQAPFSPPLANIQNREGGGTPLNSSGVPPGLGPDLAAQQEGVGDPTEQNARGGGGGH